MLIISLYDFFNQIKMFGDEKNKLKEKRCYSLVSNSDLESDCAWVQILILLLKGDVSLNNCLLSLICKMGITAVPTLQDWHEDCMS